MQKAYLSYKDKGVLFLGVFVEGDDAQIRRFIDTYHISFPVGRDNGIAKKLKVWAVPTTTFIAKGGKIIKKHFGATDYSRIILGVEELLR